MAIMYTSGANISPLRIHVFVPSVFEVPQKIIVAGFRLLRRVGEKAAINC